MTNHDLLAKQTNSIDPDGFMKLVDMNPIQQLDWVRSNVNRSAVGVDAVTMNATTAKGIEGCEVSYYIEAFTDD